MVVDFLLILLRQFDLVLKILPHFLGYGLPKLEIEILITAFSH